MIKCMKIVENNAHYSGIKTNLQLTTVFTKTSKIPLRNPPPPPSPPPVADRTFASVGTFGEITLLTKPRMRKKMI